MRIKDERAGYAKRAANLSVNAELLDQAKALEINLSATFERALDEAVRTRKRELWLAENREAIAAYNEYVARNGVFSDGLRSF
jgi:antitoxin CcdA